MKKPTILVALLILLGTSTIRCSDGSGGAGQDTDTNSDTDTDTDSDTDSSTDSDTDSDTETETEDIPDGVEWRLHDVIESIIYVRWNQQSEAQANVAYRFEGDEWMRTPVTNYAEGVQEQIVLGVPYDTDVELRLEYIVKGKPVAGKILNARTGPLPVKMLQPALNVSDPANWEPTGKYLIGSINTTNPGWSGGKYWMFIIDRQGRVVWAYETPLENFSYYVRISRDGDDILWDDITYWTQFDQGAGGRVFRMKIDGTILDSYPIPGANHAFEELRDETIAWWGMMDGGELLTLPPGGKQEVLWSCPEFYKKHGVTGSCLVNTVFWRESTDSFLISSALKDYVVEISHKTGETLKMFGQIPGAWTFDPPESAFDMNHGVTYTDAGTLLVSTHVDFVSSETVVREYELDHKNEVLREIWNYGIGEGIVVPHGGEAHRLPNGNTLHNYGEAPRAKEIAPDGTLVWDVEWSLPRMLGRTVFIDDLYVFVP